MKHLVFLLAALTLPALADEARDQRIERITKDPLLGAITSGVQKKYDVKCELTVNDIKWRCLNGPQCMYSWPTVCSAKGAGLLTSVRMTINGLDDGFENRIDSASFDKAE